MGTRKFIVHIVDDEEPVRSSLAFLLTTSGFEVRSYSSAGQFLRSPRPGRPGCLVTDVRMPDMDGVELLRQLRKEDGLLPAIVITGQGELRIAVDALRNGALDFIEKPFHADLLIAAIRRAMSPARTPATEQARQVQVRLDSLSEFEVQVLTRTAAGMHNGAIATELGLSTSVVDSCRAGLMVKVQANTLSELVRMVIATKFTGATVH